MFLPEMSVDPEDWKITCYAFGGANNGNMQISK